MRIKIDEMLPELVKNVSYSFEVQGIDQLGMFFGTVIRLKEISFYCVFLNMLINSETPKKKKKIKAGY